MILLDTNVIIHYLKGDTRIAAELQQAPPGELAISSISRYELEFGLLRAGGGKRRGRVLDEFFAGLQQIPFDTAAAVSAAKIRSELAVQGALIGPMDLSITGTALNLLPARCLGYVPQSTSVEWASFLSGVVLTREMKIARLLMSTPIALRPRARASTRDVPPPTKGSSTVSPGRVKYSMIVRAKTGENLAGYR
jgi:tRNA(fMet)-specific endonuclease VapC